MSLFVHDRDPVKKQLKNLDQLALLVEILSIGQGKKYLSTDVVGFSNSRYKEYFPLGTMGACRILSDKSGP